MIGFGQIWGHVVEEKNKLDLYVCVFGNWLAKLFNLVSNWLVKVDQGQKNPKKIAVNCQI